MIVESSPPVRVCITGVNGFIGWHLSQRLQLDPAKFVVHGGGRTAFASPTALDALVSRADVIVHLAGVNRHTDDDVLYDTNVQLAAMLIAACERTNFAGTILFASSIHESRDSAFGRAKRQARQMLADWCTRRGLRCAGLIIPNIFGAFGQPHYNSVVATFCHQLHSGQQPVVAQDAPLSLLYIDDLVHRIVSAITRPESARDTGEGHRIEPTDTVRVTELLDLFRHFHTTYTVSGNIPDLTSPFHRNLFNTYRSYADPQQSFPRRLHPHSDDRGSFVEILRLGSGGQVSFSVTRPGITRGNHFHTRKVERFAVISGSACIQLRRVGSTQRHAFYLSGAEPAYVDIPIWYAHNITNVGTEPLYTLFWINEPFDPRDADTYLDTV